ncbi:MAG: YajQ family cyclic di-GMP-binding protein [Gemmatimonadetes bacterium]|nr:YajQ family cyclic di-GMP-binding protein [Gemmatimonadota bacterium]
MASSYSFDVTTGVDLQEVDNAVNQAQKESSQRYDFKDATVLTIEFARADGVIRLHTDHDMRMRALWDIVQSKLIKRGVPVKNLEIGDNVPAGGDTLRKEITLKQALDSDTAKKVAAAIKDAKLKKVQASIQGDQVRVSGPDKDALQEAMALLRRGEFGVQLNFGNYR